MKDLRQMMVSHGARPKKMKRDEIIKWLIDNLPLSEQAENEFQSDLETDSPVVEADLFSRNPHQTLPSSVAALSADLQLQWLIKKEEIAAKQRELELNITLKREEIAAAEREREQKEREQQRAHELALRKLDQGTTSGFSRQSQSGGGPAPFKVETAVKLLPKFTEQNVEEYLITFEKMAEINGWPQEKYAAILHAMLVGKGLKVFAELDTEDCKDYAKLKEALLTAYSVVSEVHRTRFRDRTKQPSETYSDFAFFLTMHCKRWLESEHAYEDIERLREVIKLEQFYQRLHPDLHSWLIDREPETLTEAAKLADERNAIRKTHLRNQRTPVHAQPSKPSQSLSNNDTKKTETPTRNITEDQNRYRNVVCHYCHKRGHVRAQCYTRLKAEAQKTDKSEAVSQHVTIATDNVQSVTSQTDLGKINPLFHSHWSTGLLTGTDGSQRNVTLLRDTGSLQSLLSGNKIRDIDYTETGEFRLIKGITGDVMRVPLVEVELQSQFGTGRYLFGLVDSLPDDTFDALIGNDLDPPVVDDPPISVSAVTRSQTAVLKQAVIDPPSADRADTPDLSPAISADQTLIDKSDEAVKLVLNSRDELMRLQHDDASLAPLFEIAQDKSLTSDDLPCFFMQDGILLRSWQDKKVPTFSGTEVTQIVVPKPLRAKILQLAHDIPAAAHLGITKTKHRVQQHFYWPTMISDIKHYVQTCDVCQRLGKSGKPAVAPLHNLPVITEPFERIAIDIVGPLPVCRESGNRFILTVIDHCTHYPEAIPLVTHEASDVAKALVSVFSRFGFPREILSDCGSEFMSTLMKIFMNDFNIKHIRTSPYHPATNGSCERFNGTLKTMIRALVDDFPDSWDQTLPWILFAYREVPVETLGFSPFEMLFARSVPGPLSLLKDSLLENAVTSNKKSVVEFVLDMRERLRSTIDQAENFAQEQKQKSKTWYDKKARARSFEPGHEILAFLPLPGNPLQAKYCGPYRILQKLGPVDYLIDTPNRRKLQRVCHVNLLKPYCRRDEQLFPKEENLIPVSATISTTEVDFGDSIPTFSDLKESFETQANTDQLTQLQQVELNALLSEFADIFQDTPGKTNLCTHHITLVPGSKPITSTPYRLHPEKAKLVEQEIDEMLKMGIITRSDSPWASPIVVVPKTDGSIRLCVDYRKVNSVSVPDPFPLPRVEDLVDKVGRAKYLTKIDMTRGYWQVPLEEDSIPVSAFVTPSGHFEWRYMPFGLRNAPATFSRLVNRLLKGLESFSGAYLDDVIIFSDNWEEHLKHLKLVFS